MIPKLPALAPLLGTLFGFSQEPAAEPAPAAAEARIFVPETEAQRLELDPCDGAAHECEDIRSVYVDRGVAGGELGGAWLYYDFEEVTRAVTTAELAAEPELSLAVRLILSEVGADRLLDNRWGLMEAIGILYTVENRMNPEIYNPDNLKAAPVFPGCGVDGSYATCTNAQQYLGMATWRALEPASRYTPEMLEAAVDISVMAWYLTKEGLVDDPTAGATSYVHRCGGEAYGMTTYHCDASGADNVAGANPHTGPIVFRAPTRDSGKSRAYRYEISQFIDYETVRPDKDGKKRNGKPTTASPVL